MNEIIEQVHDFGESLLGRLEVLTADTTLTLLVAVLAFVSATVIFPMSVLVTADTKAERERKAELAKLIPANLMMGEQA